MEWQEVEAVNVTSCNMCGLPSWAITGPGITTRILVKPGYGEKRDRRPTVWCCSPNCAIQSHAVAEMGPATHKWPITLAEFTAANRNLILGSSSRPETYQKTRINSGSEKADFGFMGLHPLEGVSGRQKRPGGRPRKWQSEAERKRSYRRQQEERV